MHQYSPLKPANALQINSRPLLPVSNKTALRPLGRVGHLCDTLSYTPVRRTCRKRTAGKSACMTRRRVLRPNARSVSRFPVQRCVCVVVTFFDSGLQSISWLERSKERTSATEEASTTISPGFVPCEFPCRGMIEFASICPLISMSWTKMNDCSRDGDS